MNGRKDTEDMDELQELRAKLQNALRVLGETDDGLLDRYDAVRAHAAGEKIRQCAEREARALRPEFQDAFWQGMHRAADITDPEGAE